MEEKKSLEILIVIFKIGEFLQKKIVIFFRKCIIKSSNIEWVWSGKKNMHIPKAFKPIIESKISYYKIFFLFGVKDKKVLSCTTVDKKLNWQV